MIKATLGRKGLFGLHPYIAHCSSSKKVRTGTQKNKTKQNKTKQNKKKQKKKKNKKKQKKKKKKKN